MKNLNHIVYIPFTGVGVGNAARQQNWLADRIEIFRTYTLQSLKNQTNKNFMLWVSFAESDFARDEMDTINECLRESKIPYMLSFDGLMYWDDKFDRNPVAIIKNAMRVVRGCWRNKAFSGMFRSLLELLKDKNGTLEQRLGGSLWNLRRNMPESGLVYMTRLDSDDMLHRDAIQKIQSTPIDDYGAICMLDGYILNEDTFELGEWNPTTNPPFHTIIFEYDTFFDPKRHMARYNGFRSHEDIPNVLNSKFIDERLYCVLTHDPKNHISTNWDHPFRGKLSNPSKGFEIQKLIEFGLGRLDE